MRYRAWMPALIALLLLPSPSALAAECVILLHGLGRTANSMNAMQHGLREAGYTVINVDYPSREKTVEELAELAVASGLEQCASAGASAVHFVTHSLGGILVRQYYRVHATGNLRRVVMLAPPNNGSEIVDLVEQVPLLRELQGPASRQLGTGEENPPKQLGPVNFQLGIIAGDKSLSWMSLLLPNPDDGKVSVESTKVRGMCSFIQMPVTHTFMMRHPKVIRQAEFFLRHGLFNGEGAQFFDC